MDRLAVNHGRVGEHRDASLGAILVAQAEGVVDDFRKVRVTCRFAVACKSEYVGQLTIMLHLLQLLFQFGGHFLTCWQWQGRAVVFVEATLAIDAVERTDLAVGRQQVDAERDAKAAAVDRAENRRRIDDSTHNGGKGTKNFELRTYNFEVCDFYTLNIFKWYS